MGNEYWIDRWDGGDNEFNLISFDKRIYAVVRNPDAEQIILFEFTPDHEGHALCFIRSTQPLFHGTTAAPVNKRTRWDYHVYGRVDLAYRLYLSKDDVVCRALLQALNHPRPDGNKQLWASGPARPWYALSIYRDPLFLPWKPHELSPRIRKYPYYFNPSEVEWMAVPLYNDGKDVAVVRDTSFPGRTDASLQEFRVLRTSLISSARIGPRTGKCSRTRRVSRCSAPSIPLRSCHRTDSPRR
ncbi:MAG: hypothetical protein ACHQRJ_14255 [Alphaproteobacteria bacterium]